MSRWRRPGRRPASGAIPIPGAEMPLMNNTGSPAPDSRRRTRTGGDAMSTQRSCTSSPFAAAIRCSTARNLASTPIGATRGVERRGPVEVLLGPERFPRLYALSGWGTMLGLAAVALVAAALPMPVIPGYHRAVVAVFFGVVALLAGLGLAAPALSPPKLIRVLTVLSSPCWAVFLHFFGPRLEVAVAPLVFLGITCTFWLTRRWVVVNVAPSRLRIRSRSRRRLATRPRQAASWPSSAPSWSVPCSARG